MKEHRFLIIVFKTVFAAALSAVSVLFFSSCNKSDIPDNYVARSVVGENVKKNQLGIPVVSDNCQEIYLYKNKTYIAVTYKKAGQEVSKEVSSSISFEKWEDLVELLGDPIIMKEGDVATLPKESFIRYMETHFP